jgi:Peptidase family M23
MATNKHHLNARSGVAGRLAALAIACLAGLAALAATADARPSESAGPAAAPRCAGAPPTTVASFLSVRTTSATSAFDWPLKPFNRQHPVRGFFNDPREAEDGSRSFHFGIDISAPDDTPVYAVEAGVIRGSRGRSVNVVTSSGHLLAYWHIVPVVHEGQSVRRHQLLGRIQAPWGHVHFAEAIEGKWVNPLRPGALGPYRDHTAPTVARMRIGHRHDHSSELVVDTYDTTPMAVAPPWNDMPVTPSLITWRLVGPGGASAWKIGVDSRLQMPNNGLFWQRYARDTKKNDPPKPGRYCFRVARWQRANFPRATGIQVAVYDTRGNRTIAMLRLTR